MTTPSESPTTADAPQLDRLQSAKGFIFDMDGVLYLGSKLLPGVNGIFNALRLRELPFLLATNNSTATPQAFVDKLKDMVHVRDEDIEKLDDYVTGQATQGPAR